MSPLSCLYLPDIWGIYLNNLQCVIISELNINWEKIQVFVVHSMHGNPKYWKIQISKYDSELKKLRPLI